MAHSIPSGFLQSERACTVKAPGFVSPSLFQNTPFLLLYSVLEKEVTKSSPHSEGDSYTRMWISGGRITGGPTGGLPTTETIKQPQLNDSSKDLKKEAYNI